MTGKGPLMFEEIRSNLVLAVYIYLPALLRMSKIKTLGRTQSTKGFSILSSSSTSHILGMRYTIDRFYVEFCVRPCPKFDTFFKYPCVSMSRHNQT